MLTKPKLGIVAALEREVWPLVKHWKTVRREHDGRQHKFFDSDSCVVICGGIGEESARRATEATICLYRPSLMISAGFAGALQAGLQVGVVIRPARVVDLRDGSSTETCLGVGALLTSQEVAGPEQKARLAEAYGASAIDMEAAAVARGASAHDVAFGALKVISDELGFAMPAMHGFIGRGGQFQAVRFAAFAALRPWMWKDVYRLATGSALASRVLCRELCALIAAYESGKEPWTVEKLGKTELPEHLNLQGLPATHGPARETAITQ